MFKYYNPKITNDQLFLSHLIADNGYYAKRLGHHREKRMFDVMFSGRMAQEKNPLFFAAVCVAVREMTGRCKALVIGDGEEPLKREMREIMEAGGVESEFPGFIRHSELPDYYANARLLLLPTSGDCWGVVINEAMLAGTPVVTTAMTAAAGELVLDGQNGRILPLDVAAWSSVIVDLLSDRKKWESFSLCARSTVEHFNPDRAASGLIEAFKYLEGR